MGVADDSLEVARIATREMVQLMSARRGMDEVCAYLLRSVCADLRISEVVDEPNWIVSLCFPRVVFAWAQGRNASDRRISPQNGVFCASVHVDGGTAAKLYSRLSRA